MKKTRVFELLDPTPEKWNIYESLIPALNKSYGFHCDYKIKGHLERRKICRVSNLLTIDFYAETDKAFYHIDYEAIKMFAKAGIEFKMISTFSEYPIQEQEFIGQYQLEKQNQDTWDLWMFVADVFDLLSGKYGVKNTRVLFRKHYAMELYSKFLSWRDFSDYTFECGAISAKHHLKILPVMKCDIGRAYQADLFDDIIHLTDPKRIRVHV